MNVKKALLVVAVPAAAMGLAGVAYAATLNLTTATVGAAQATVNSCTTGQVTTSYGTPTDTGSGFTISQITVTLTGPDASNCAGKKIYITLTDGSNVLASGATQPMISSLTTSYTIGLTASPSLANVKATDIAIQ